MSNRQLTELNRLQAKASYRKLNPQEKRTLDRLLYDYENEQELLQLQESL